jgi:predicted nucleic acid-binding protein
MAGYLLDTNVLSEVIKKRPSPAVLGRLREAPQDALFASAVSVMEMRFGAVRSPGGSALWERIRTEVLARIKILPLGQDEASRAGEILADLEARGTPIGIEDVMIGATALVADLVVVTRNLRHLARIRGLVIENWWQE